MPFDSSIHIRIESVQHHPCFIESGTSINKQGHRSPRGAMGNLAPQKIFDSQYFLLLTIVKRN